MKRLWFCALLLILLFSATLWNVSYLGRFTAQVTALLYEAEVHGDSGDWSGAQTITEEAKALWESRKYYLYITLFHVDTNKVYVGFREVLELIDNQHGGEYSLVNVRLIADIDLIHKMNKFSLHNIL